MKSTFVLYEYKFYRNTDVKETGQLMWGTVWNFQKLRL